MFAPRSNNAKNVTLTTPPNLSDYIAVPGKIIPIPGTAFVLISPINPSNVTEANSYNPAFDHSSSFPPPPPLSSQIKRRGRPFVKTRPCQCPNCQDMTGVDGHLCHFANCGKTFTKICHLEVHLRNHMGARTFQCPEPAVGQSLSGQTILKDIAGHTAPPADSNVKCVARDTTGETISRCTLLDAVRQMKSAKRSAK